MFCPKCGASASGAFCNTCGAPMGQPVPAPAPPPQAYQPPPQGYPPPPPPPPPYAPPYTPGTAPVYPGGPVFDYAQWGTRALGYIVDMLIVCVVVVPIYFLFGVALAGLFATMSTHSEVCNGIGYLGCCMVLIIVPLVSLLVGLYNSVYLIYTRGFSIGQGVVKIKVVNAQGQLLSGGTAFLRLLIRVVFQFIAVLSILDMLWPLWDERRQTLHDKIANSYVINNPSGR